jgi:hypothetical protein
MSDQWWHFRDQSTTETGCLPNPQRNRAPDADHAGTAGSERLRPVDPAGRHHVFGPVRHRIPDIRIVMLKAVKRGGPCGDVVTRRCLFWSR